MTKQKVVDVKSKQSKKMKQDIIKLRDILVKKLAEKQYADDDEKETLEMALECIEILEPTTK